MHEILVQRRLGVAFWCTLLAASVTSCTVIASYSRLPGVRYIASVGNPPADTLLWSPQYPDRIVINANGLGYGPARIYILDLSTRQETVLASTPYGEISASSWSPDGKYLAVSISSGTKGFQSAGLWAMNANDQSMRYIGSRENAFWLPDGNQLAVFDFLSNEDPPGVGVSLLDLATGNRMQIYGNPEAEYVVGRSALGDGRFLVFSLQFESGDSSLFVLDLLDRRATQLTHGGSSAFPQWSPDGKIIAYQKYGTGHEASTSSIHLIQFDGSCDQRLPGIDDAMSPTWSPDGRMLAFIGPDGIYTVDVAKALGRDISNGLCVGEN